MEQSCHVRCDRQEGAFYLHASIVPSEHTPFISLIAEEAIYSTVSEPEYSVINFWGFERSCATILLDITSCFLTSC